MVPNKWRDYACDDYFESRLAADGFWDEAGQLWLIEPTERVAEEPEADFLQVGRPGVDDIGFGYRKNQPGFWAFHRMVDREFQYLAPSVQDFLDGWLAGKISI